MCAHSESASDVTARLSGQLYPLVAAHFEAVQEYNKRTPPCDGAAHLFAVVTELRAEFESLRNYEIKLVFPSVLKVFNTKHDPSFSLPVNIRELQQLTQNKEKHIAGLTDELQEEAEHLGLYENHPVCSLCSLLQTSFKEAKAQWNDMMNGWNRQCSCFAAVLLRQEQEPVKGNHSEMDQ